MTVLGRLYVMTGISFELLRQSPERFVKVPSMLLLSVILARAKQSLSGPFGELRRSCPHEPLCQLLFSTSSPSESRAGQRMSPGLLIDNHLHNKAKRAVKQLRSDVINALAWISCWQQQEVVEEVLPGSKRETTEKKMLLKSTYFPAVSFFPCRFSLLEPEIRIRRQVHWSVVN